MKKTLNFLKKQGVGFYIGAVVALFALISLILYFVNCNADYYVNDGIDGAVVRLTAAAFVAQVAYLISMQFLKNGLIRRLLFILQIAVIFCITVAFMLLFGERLLSITSIMTFDKNDYNLADMATTIRAMIFYVLTALLSVIGAGFAVRKD